MKVWQRPEPPVAQQRKRKPIEEQERSRWLEGYQGACKLTQACPATLGGNMADRAGDIQQYFGHFLSERGERMRPQTG
jgi:truncated hemoglobin YjbI